MSNAIQDETETFAKRGRGRPKLGSSERKHVGVFLDETSCRRLEELSVRAGLSKSEYITRLLAVGASLSKGTLVGSNESSDVSIELKFFQFRKEIESYFGLGEASVDSQMTAETRLSHWRRTPKPKLPEDVKKAKARERAKKYKNLKG